MARQNKKGAGRPSPFKPEYCEQTVKLCKLGATDKDLADFFGVVESTINNWKAKHPEFLVSIREGKIIADVKVANALFDGALDRVVIEKQAFKVKVGPNQEKVEIVEVEKIIPADFRNQQFWLKNRKSDVWRDKVETGFTNKDGEDINPVMIFQLPDNGRDKDNKTAARVPNQGAKQRG